MAHIGDMDLQRVVAVVQPLHPHGIVEIARRLAVDGDDIERPKVLPPGDLVFRNHCADRLRLLDRRHGKPMGDVMLADHHLDVNAEVVRVPEHFNHAPHGVIVILGKLENLAVHDHPVQIRGPMYFDRRRAHTILRGALLGNLQTVRDLDPLADAVVVRDHERAASLHPELAHHLRVCSPQHPDDLAIGAPIALDSSNTHQHAVAVHSLLRRFGRNKDVPPNAFNRLIGNQEAVAVAMHVQPAGRILPADPRGDIVTRAQLYQLAPFSVAVERTLQFLLAVPFRAQFPQKLFPRRAPMGKMLDVLKKLTIHRGHYRRSARPSHPAPPVSR
jgi:hypothetical protein